MKRWSGGTDRQTNDKNHENENDSSDAHHPSSLPPRAATPKRRRTIKKCWWPTFPHSGNTRAVAERIAAATGADLFEIVPQKPYPAEYRAVVDQARREIAADYRPALKTDLPDAGRYDVIYIGSPCWWSTVAPPVATFLAAHDFTGKTLIPFMTHEGSRMGRSEADIRRLCPGATVRSGVPHPRQRCSAGRPRNPTARRGGRTLSADGTPTVGTARANTSRNPPRRAADVGEPTETDEGHFCGRTQKHIKRPLEIQSTHRSSSGFSYLCP